MSWVLRVDESCLTGEDMGGLEPARPSLRVVWFGRPVLSIDEVCFRAGAF